MTCDLPREELSAYWDGALAPEAAARAAAHAERCLSCREALGLWRGLDAALAAAPDAPPASVGLRLAAEVRRRGRLRLLRRGLAAAAVVAVAAGAGFRLASGPAADPDPPPLSRAALEARVVAGTGGLIDALELDASALKLELSTADVPADRRRAVEAKLDDLLRRIDDARAALAVRR